MAATFTQQPCSCSPAPVAHTLGANPPVHFCHIYWRAPVRGVLPQLIKNCLGGGGACPSSELQAQSFDIIDALYAIETTMEAWIYI